MVRVLFVFVALLLTFAPSEARHHHRRHVAPVQTWQPFQELNFLAGVRSITVKMHRVSSHRHRRSRVKASPWKGVTGLVQKVSGLVQPLADKVNEIKRDCGSQMISGVRHTYIAGTHIVSLHASGKAADVSGNPSCIYAHLASWPGGYSTDYASVRHVHISYDAEHHREWGVRFVHGGHYGRHYRYAHRVHHRMRHT